MVERTSSEGLEEFVGIVDNIEIQEGENGSQYHLEIEPVDKDVLKNSKTGHFHEWLRISSTATETSVPEGSVLSEYIRAVERLYKDAKNKEKVADVLDMLKGKKIVFVREKLGKAYGGHEAADHWVPNKEA